MARTVSARTGRTLGVTRTELMYLIRSSTWRGVLANCRSSGVCLKVETECDRPRTTPDAPGTPWILADVARGESDDLEGSTKTRSPAARCVHAHALEQVDCGATRSHRRGEFGVNPRARLRRWQRGPRFPGVRRDSFTFARRAPCRGSASSGPRRLS